MFGPTRGIQPPYVVVRSALPSRVNTHSRTLLHHVADEAVGSGTHRQGLASIHSGRRRAPSDTGASLFLMRPRLSPRGANLRSCVEQRPESRPREASQHLRRHVHVSVSSNGTAAFDNSLCSSSVDASFLQYNADAARATPSNEREHRAQQQ